MHGYVELATKMPAMYYRSRDMIESLNERIDLDLGDPSTSSCNFIFQP